MAARVGFAGLVLILFDMKGRKTLAVYCVRIMIIVIWSVNGSHSGIVGKYI